MGKHKKPKPEPPRIITAREWLGAATGTNPEDWVEISTGTRLYAKGYRYRNRNTNQLARRPHVQQPRNSSDAERSSEESGYSSAPSAGSPQ